MEPAWLVVGALGLAALVGALLTLRNRGVTTSRPGSPPAVAATDESPEGALVGPVGNDGMVEVLHPMIRRAAAAGVKRGGSAARYLAERDGRYYFDLSRIPDEARRRHAAALFAQMRDGSVDIRDAIQLIQDLTGRED